MADITPNKVGYIRMLETVINHSCSKKDVAWCEVELKRVLELGLNPIMEEEE